MTYVHELGFADCPKAYVFRGDKELTGRQVQDQLGLTLSSDPLNKGENSALKRFLVPVSECEFALNSILDDL
jgi:protein transport protein SEC23